MPLLTRRTRWLCLLFKLIPGSLHAQSPEGPAVRIVRDASGAVIPAAEVKAHNPGTNIVRQVTSGHEGRFPVSNIDPGHYAVTVTAKGSETLHEIGLELQVKRAARLELTLKVGRCRTP